jgi:hypothetical protein
MPGLLARAPWSSWWFTITAGLALYLRHGSIFAEDIGGVNQTLVFLGFARSLGS